MTSDLELLRAYEPVIRYTEGELFFPTAVEPYLAECDLLVGRRRARQRLLVAARRARSTDNARSTRRPARARRCSCAWSSSRSAAWRSPSGRDDRTDPVFRAPGRLARVGLFARLVDAGFNASLLLRGNVPGRDGGGGVGQVRGRARAGIRATSTTGGSSGADGWIVLHYLYFYFMNDWRSTFAGANDHEADLEQAFVVLEDAPGWAAARSGSAAPPTTTPATSSAGAGTTRTSASSGTTR